MGQFLRAAIFHNVWHRPFDYSAHVSSGSGPMNVLYHLYGIRTTSTAKRSVLIHSLLSQFLQFLLSRETSAIAASLWTLLTRRAGLCSRLGRPIRLLPDALDLQVFLCMCHMSFFTWERVASQCRYTFVASADAYQWEQQRLMSILAPRSLGSTDEDVHACPACSTKLVDNGDDPNGRRRYFCSYCRSSTYV